MKHIILCLALILLISGYVKGQDDILLLRKKTNQKSKIINEGSRISLKTRQDSLVKGSLHILNDSAVIVNSDTFLLSEIEHLRILDSQKGAIGSVEIILGSALSFTGILIGTLSIMSWQADFALLNAIGVIISIPITILGIKFLVKGIRHLSTYHKYSQKRWQYIINPKLLH